VPHLFETNYTSDETESGKPGATPDDYDYLIHTLTKDMRETYELVQSWRKILDDYAYQHNTSEKVYMVLTFLNSLKYICHISSSKYYEYEIIYEII